MQLVEHFKFEIDNYQKVMLLDDLHQNHGNIWKLLWSGRGIMGSLENTSEF